MSKGRQYGGTLRALKRVLALAKLVAAERPYQDSTWMEVQAFGFFMRNVYVPDDARDWLREIATNVPIFWLAYGVSSRADGIGNFYGPFLWRLLAPHPSRRAHLGLQSLTINAHGVCGPRQIIALCSALAQSQTLREFSFIDGGFGVSEADSRVWTSWLAFVLFSRNSRHCIRKVHLDVQERVQLYASAMSHVLKHVSPIAYLVAIVDGGDNASVPIANWSPRTARLRANAKILGSDLPADCAATTVYHGKQTAECHLVDGSYGEFARILIPGVDFGCVHKAEIESVQPMPRSWPHAVKAFSIRGKRMDFTSVQTILDLVGGPLTSVSIHDTRKRDRHSVVDIPSLLASCPLVKRVHLNSLTFSLDSDRVEYFHYQHYLDGGTQGLENASVSLNVFPPLSSLYVDTGVQRHLPKLQEFLLALDVERDLERFVVVASDATVHAKYVQNVKKRDGHAIPGLLPHHKRAFLSVVSVGAKHARLRGCQLDPDTINHMFELAARSTHTRTTFASAY